MIEELFNALSGAMTEEFEIVLAASFAWGILSIVLSPCHLSSIPLIIGYIGKQAADAKRTLLLSAVFAFGILITIALTGVATAALGRMLGDVGMGGNLLVAGVFFVVGLYMLDVVKFSWNSVQLRPLAGRPWIGALVLGLIFGIGLGPCTFAFLAPVLGVVFSIGAESIVKAISLVAAFGAGHCTVIVAAGSLVNVVQRYLNWTDNSQGALWMRRVAGVCVLLGGFYFAYTAF